MITAKRSIVVQYERSGGLVLFGSSLLSARRNGEGGNEGRDGTGRDGTGRDGTSS
jgi:hypothetical protein